MTKKQMLDAISEMFYSNIYQAMRDTDDALYQVRGIQSTCKELPEPEWQQLSAEIISLLTKADTLLSKLSKNIESRFEGNVPEDYIPF